MNKKLIFSFFTLFVATYFLQAQKNDSTFLLAFGSCNKTETNNPFWDDILEMNPDVFIWGGDNIYADTKNMKKLQKMYEAQKNLPKYAKVVQSIPVLGTWDDHDYGINDGGKNFSKRKESQQLFLDFLDVPQDDPRRDRAGVYHSKTFTIKDKSIKIVVLDTRYHRTKLTDAKEKGKRYQPNTYGKGTLLGKKQWQWLEEELTNNTATFTVFVTSIQLLSGEHGFETWANFPHEVDRFITLLKKTNTRNAIVLSGDRHISEFSKLNYPGITYPIIDFTSSGLTHVYSSYDGEPNTYRIKEVVSKKSFGTLSFDFKAQRVQFKMMGDEGAVLQEYTQHYN